jgi:UDP-N-acetyl-D-mannosaminuronic acid dehydrogenase
VKKTRFSKFRLVTSANGALEDCGVLIALVDHDVFKVIPAEERQGRIIYDTRGIWPDVA